MTSTFECLSPGNLVNSALSSLQTAWSSSLVVICFVSCWTLLTSLRPWLENQFLRPEYSIFSMQPWIHLLGLKSDWIFHVLLEYFKQYCWYIRYTSFFLQECEGIWFADISQNNFFSTFHCIDLLNLNVMNFMKMMPKHQNDYSLLCVHFLVI